MLALFSFPARYQQTYRIVKFFRQLIVFSIALACSAQSGARELMASETFLAEQFSTPPAMKTLWLTAAQRTAAQAQFGYQLPALRLRYWCAAKRSAWVLDEIGKEQPITIGVAVDAGRIASVRILEYRESRGGEVRHDFFTRQFDGAALDTQQKLTRNIDGITGATLSVHAVTRVARVALWLAGQVGDDCAAH